MIAVKVIAAPLAVRKRVRSNGALLGNAINAAWPGDSIIEIGNAPIVVVSRSAIPNSPRHRCCQLKPPQPKKT